MNTPLIVYQQVLKYLSRWERRYGRRRTNGRGSSRSAGRSSLLSQRPHVASVRFCSPPSVSAARARSRSSRRIDCEACAVHLRGALAKVGGFHDLEMDIANQQIRIRYEPAPGRLEAYVAAIDKLGYEAALPASATSEGDGR